MKVDIDRRHWVIRDASPRDTGLFRQIPGATCRSDIWYVPATLAGAWQLAGLFPGELDKSPDADQVLRDLAAFAREQEEIREGRRKFAVDDRLYDFQKIGASFIINDQCALVADEMGTGKTVQALAAVQFEQAYPLLIVCTKTMQHKWAAEARIWTDEEPVVIEGSKKKRDELLAARPDIAIINYEALRLHSSLAGYGSIAKEGEPGLLNEIPWVSVIADEVHKAKEPKAKQTRALWEVSKNAEWRIGLTGTPVVNDPDDLWAIMHFISPEEWPSRNRFRERYCHIMAGFFGGVDNVGLRKDTEPELRKFLDPRFIRRTKEEVLTQLPPKTHELITLPMAGKQRTAYNAMMKDMLADVEGQILMAPNPLTRLMRLRQLASGYPVVNDDNEVIALDTPSNKLEAILDMLEEHGPGVVIYADSRKLVEMLDRELRKKDYSTGLITGKVTGEMRAINVEDFQQGKTDVILGTIGAGAEGITLTRADLFIFAQHSWSNSANKQAEDRIHRIGQNNAATIVTLASEGTVDLAVEAACHMKEQRLQEVCRDPAWLRKALKGQI